MTQTFLALSIEPERLIGHLMKAISKNEKLNVSISMSNITTPNAPSYVNQPLGLSVWVKESQYQR